MSARLLPEHNMPHEAPPAYDFPPHEEFELEESPVEPPTWIGRIRRFGKTTVVAPVRHIIDPVAHWWHCWITRGIVARFDAALAPVINPLLARRLLVLIFTLLLLSAVYMSRDATNLELGVVHRDPAYLRRLARPFLADIDSLKTHSDFLGKMPHLAGSVGGRSTAKYVHETLESLGITSSPDRHDVLLSHFNSTDLWVLEDSEEVWHTGLTEGTALKDPTTSQQQPRPQMALGIPDDVTGPLIYANFGTEEDLAYLTSQNVDLHGAILLVRRPDTPGPTAKRAEDAGASGVIYVNDPLSTPWPAGPDYADDAIELGSLGLSDLYPGDPLSPGWPSSMAMRVEIDKAYIPHIPVAAIARTHFAKLSEEVLSEGLEAPRGWWSEHIHASKIGPHSAKKVRLKTGPVLEERHQISNVFGRIPGIEEEDKIVILGARMDSFCYGSSELGGLAALLHVAHTLAYLRFEHKWQPLRTIYFVAWDGTDQNWAGSTEWVESRADSLMNEGIAYIDLGSVEADAKFMVQGNPLFEVASLLNEVTYSSGSLSDAVDMANSFVPISSYGNWLGFDPHTGVPSLRLGWNGVAPRASCYDTSEWMHKFGDPALERSRALAEIATYVALDLSTSPILAFNVSRMASEIKTYAQDVDRLGTEIFGDRSALTSRAMKELEDAVDKVTEAGTKWAEWKAEWEGYNASCSDASGFYGESPLVARTRVYWNARLTMLNRIILDRNGIAIRNWYKNHLFGPPSESRDERYAGTFPAVRDALSRRDQRQFSESFYDAAQHIHEASTFADDL